MRPAADEPEPILIVGAGPIGLACAISARRRGHDPLIIDAGAIANSIVRYPVGMIFFTTPERLEIGGHPLTTAGPKATREEALKYYRGVVRAEGLRVRPWCRFLGAEPAAGGLRCRLRTERGEESLSARRLVLATGYFDHPNRLDIPGEDLPHVSHWAGEPHLTAGLDLVIVGGKNSAVEHALNCFRAGARVTLVYRRRELRRTVKYWLLPDLENRVKAGEIAARWEHTVVEITPGYVDTRGPEGAIERLPADRVAVLTGYHPDFDLLRSLGIRLDPESGRPEHDPETLETNVAGIYIAGSLTAGRTISEIFIENGRFDGEKVFGDREARRRADDLYTSALRPEGE
ncbi:MAG: YpdA family putative bacillithiol disulfide reductase [Gemmatimonadales bacterium]